MAKAICPECDVAFELIAPGLGQLLNCPACDQLLEVIGLNPLELDWAETEDDFDFDLDDDEDFELDDEDLELDDDDLEDEIDY
jgi:lysine biosynthesis protein LysW